MPSFPDSGEFYPGAMYNHAMDEEHEEGTRLMSSSSKNNSLDDDHRVVDNGSLIGMPLGMHHNHHQLNGFNGNSMQASLSAYNSQFNNAAQLQVQVSSHVF
jgi:hypothetical protein